MLTGTAGRSAGSASVPQAAPLPSLHRSPRLVALEALCAPPSPLPSPFAPLELLPAAAGAAGSSAGAVAAAASAVAAISAVPAQPGATAAVSDCPTGLPAAPVPAPALLLPLSSRMRLDGGGSAAPAGSFRNHSRATL